MSGGIYVFGTMSIDFKLSARNNGFTIWTAIKCSIAHGWFWQNYNKEGNHWTFLVTKQNIWLCIDMIMIIKLIYQKLGSSLSILIYFTIFLKTVQLVWSCCLKDILGDGNHTNWSDSYVR